MPQPEISVLEIEIAQLEQALASKQQTLERQKAAGEISEIPPAKETLREIVGEKIGPLRSPTPLAPAPSPGADRQSVTSGRSPVTGDEPPSYLYPELKEKVQELVNVAFSQSIDQAIKETRAADNAALLDAFHDAMVDELYDRLVARGKLKKI